jgi:hypothetical protein
MKKTSIIIGLVISLLVIPSTLTIFMASSVKADTYSSDFDMNKKYIYDVNKWDQELQWYYTSDQGYVNSSAGGQIRVKFTGFFEFETPSWENNTFENPLPFINISFYERKDDTLHLNRTMVNESSAEAANVMALGYNEFDAGFLIPTDNFTRLQNRVEAQNESGTWELSSYGCELLSESVKIYFKQASGSQNTTLYYDKITGTLLKANVQSAFGPDFKIELNKEQQNISAYPIFILAGVSGITILISIFITRKKFKH